MSHTCKSCKFFSDAGYREHFQTQHVGFCSRFTQTENKEELACSHFALSPKKEDYESIKKRAVSYGIPIMFKTTEIPFPQLERQVLEHEKKLELEQWVKEVEIKEVQFKLLL